MAALFTTALVLALLSVGMTAGAMAVYAHAIMPGLRSCDDRTLVGMMVHANREILNGWFISGFLGTAVFSLAAAILGVTASGGAVLAWTLVGAAGALSMVVITAAVNVPLNNELDDVDVETASETGLAEARRRFEARWTKWNTVRAFSAFIGFAAFAVALAVA
ncbi:anthrone oxygenase family protein [Salininema proteolyticum]|uniref:DUF1772 domain-containing protein n=1 Tax=Salininema proteolyticum TaxID=1607685 RepID=A0ABV8TV90_9ACTN